MNATDKRGRWMAGVFALALFACTCVSVYGSFPSGSFGEPGYRVGDWLDTAVDAWHIVSRASLLAAAFVAIVAIGSLVSRRLTGRTALSDDEYACRLGALSFTIVLGGALIYRLSPLYLRIPHIDEVFRMEFLQSWYKYGELRNLGLAGVPAMAPYTWSELMVAGMARLLDLNPNYIYLAITPALWHLLIAATICGLLLRRLPRTIGPFFIRALFAITAGVGFWFLIQADLYWLARQNVAAFLLVLLCAEVYLDFNDKRVANVLWLFVVLLAGLFTKVPLVVVLVGACVLVPWLLPVGTWARRGLYSVIPVVAYAVYQWFAPDLLSMVAPSLDPWAGIKAILAKRHQTYGGNLDLTWEWIKFVQDQFTWIWMALVLRLFRRLRGGPPSPMENTQLLWFIAFGGALAGWSVISFGNLSSNTTYWLHFAAWFGALAVLWELAIWMSGGLRYATIAYAILCGLLIAGIPAVQNMAANHMRILWMVYDPHVVKTMHTARARMEDDAVLLHNLQSSRLALYASATGGIQAYMGFWYFMLSARVNPTHVDSIDAWFTATFCEARSLPLPPEIPVDDLWIWYWGSCEAQPQWLQKVETHGPMSKLFRLDAVAYRRMVAEHNGAGYLQIHDRWLMSQATAQLSYAYALTDAQVLSVMARGATETTWSQIYTGSITLPVAEDAHVEVVVPTGHQVLRLEIQNLYGQSVSDFTESFYGVPFMEIYSNCRVQKLCR